jgi:hypothetical protein
VYAQLTVRLQNPSVDADFSAYVCTVSANDSKVGEALFKNAKYASLGEVSAPSASTIIEGIQKGKLWLGVDPSDLPSIPITLQLRLSGVGYVNPSPRLLNIALIGLFLFLMGQPICHFAASANSGKAALWRHSLKRLSKLGIVSGLGVVLLGAVLDVLNHGIGGPPRSTLFAALSASLSASRLLPEIDFAEKSIEDKTLLFSPLQRALCWRWGLPSPFWCASCPTSWLCWLQTHFELQGALFAQGAPKP